MLPKPRVTIHLEVEGSFTVACGLPRFKAWRAEEEEFFHVIQMYDEFGDTLTNAEGIKLITNQVSVPCPECKRLLTSLEEVDL